MEDWDKVFNINLKSAFFISKEFALYNIERKAKCKIILTASLLGYQGGYRSSAYTASKHGVIGITKLLSNEWGQYGINVNCVVPGYIKTKMTEEFINNIKVSDRYLNRIPLGYWGRPEDVIGAVLFLASKASDYMTGAAVVVDGGYLNT
jgi:2-deoxy-D-gluconate 3-dehydrogenase